MPATSNLEFVIGRLERATARVVTKLSLDITANLKEDTPRDTGWARANWIPSIGAPKQSAVGSRENVSAAEAAQTAGEASLLGFKLGRGIVFITNNVPYITDLNEGSSKQAPAGFVQNDIDRAVRGLRGVNAERI